MVNKCNTGRNKVNWRSFQIAELKLFIQTPPLQANHQRSKLINEKIRIKIILVEVDCGSLKVGTGCTINTLLALLLFNSKIIMKMKMKKKKLIQFFVKSS